MVTGKRGFLYKELEDKIDDSDELIFLLGSPTFDGEISKNQSKILHKYVKETIEIINNNINKYIVFASSTGVDDVDYKHKGSMSYTLAKLFLENYIINHCDDYLILRIGTIISDDISKVKEMKDTRIQQRILRKEMRNISLQDNYLDINQFINETCDIIKLHKNGIHEYNLTFLKLSELMRYSN